LSRQNKPNIRDLREIWGRFGAIKRNPEFDQNRDFSILETGSTRTYKKEHELYDKFDEDHEYVVLLCVR
jgi:hypothetical protein